MRTILVGLDGSESADRATEFSATLAKACGAKLVLVCVAAVDAHLTVDAGFKAMLESEQITLGEFLENEARMTLEKAKPRAEKIRGGSVGTVVRLGEAAETIIALLPEYDDPLIVVGRRGRGQLAGLLLGSVSQKLTTHAPCPVIIVP